MNRLRKRSAPSAPSTPTRSLPSPSSKTTIQTSTSYNSNSVALVRSPRQNVISTPGTTLPVTPTGLPIIPLQPQSAVEHYWAARALTAEALLTARVTHHRELQSVSYTQDVRRSRDLAALSKVHEAMHAKMEKFVMALLVCLILFIVLVAYLLAQTHHYKSKRASRWWAALPSHFTIPILSPFTSVVEHETSVVGTQTIAIFLVVLAGLGYAMFRYWVHSRARMNHA